MLFERALQTIDPSVYIPYFDSNLDYHLGDDLATQTVTWTDDFAGNGDGRVTTGPYADWSLPFPVDNRRFLFRNLTFAPGSRTAPSLMSDQALTTILNARRLRNICWNVDSSFESFHGATHNWVGGVMVNLPSSPSDPMFFLHHSFVDCLWTSMRDNQRAQGINVEYDYPNDTVSMGVGMRRQGDGRRIQSPEDSLHHSLAEMRPFGIRNIDGLSSAYEDRVRCAPRPTCSRSDTSCGGSDYLFCDESTYRCAPKLRLGAQCARFSRYSPCSGGTCCDGVCRRTCRNQIEEPVEPNEVPVRTRPTDRPTDEPARRPQEQPDPPREEVRPQPMEETMHGATEEIETDVPENSLEPRHEPRPENPIINTDQNQRRPETFPESSGQSVPEEHRPVQLPDEVLVSERPLNERSQTRQSTRGIIFPRVHPGVPTHAPYVIPTQAAVPTHAPYVVPQAPTHPPGFGIIPAAPTHPPSVFENNRIVKRDERSVNRHHEKDDYREIKPRPYRTDQEYEESRRPEYENNFHQNKEEYFDEYSNRPYREYRRPHHSGRYRPIYEESYHERTPNRNEYTPPVNREQRIRDYENLYDQEQRYRLSNRHEEDNHYNRRIL